MASPPPTLFSDFPEDVQLNVLSFLSPAEVSAFACTSRRFASLCSASASDSPVWHAMCERRWGSKTLLRSWASGAAATGRVPYARLYRTLDRWESFIGFWRRIGQGTPGTLPLVFFEWGPSYITGSWVSPSVEAGTYGVLKVPFLWLGLSAHGDPVSFLHPGSQFESPGEFFSSALGPSSDSDLVPVTVSFMGCNHFVVEENRSFYAEDGGGDGGVSDEVAEIASKSPPDRLMSEIYQYFANRTSPGGDKASRRHRKKEREKLGRRRLWEAEHFVKIVNYQPTPSRPLQGLWKGICEDNVLDFYLVSYDDVGGITCRRVGDAGELFSGYSPVFWTSNATFLESPFSKEEQDLYGSREHIRAVASNWSNMDREVVLRILCINSSYDLVIPDLSGSSGDPRNVEGRIWEYEDGTFGFGFLRNNFIIDLKHITLDGIRMLSLTTILEVHELL
ncbi:F-box protein At3g12350 isoform X2 [Elaeis guineensis]|uniref:F-box protein n=1 Tax=Elaeis guineensis var. tenera TaxID=51953 RepID=A0A6I9S7X2_ELAGV|nr:F-box protein At3g12350 isoform X2 [Elaeis guineensis]